MLGNEQSYPGGREEHSREAVWAALIIPLLVHMWDTVQTTHTPIVTAVAWSYTF